LTALNLTFVQFPDILSIFCVYHLSQKPSLSSIAVKLFYYQVGLSQ